MEYPYYIIPDIEEYRKLDPESEEAKILSRRIAANIGDHEVLRRVLGKDTPEVADYYPDLQHNTPSTLDTIDSFLDKFGGNISSDGYLPGNDDIKEVVEEKEELPDTFQDMVKKGLFEEAIQLIERQNLNNPQKSIYFAHQISFLKKLMAINKYRKQTQG